MVNKRPCRICGKWFQPDPRAGDRQRACSSSECQRERHRRACNRWHHENPDYDRERRLRQRLRRMGQRQRGEGFECEVLRGSLDWLGARDAVGLQVCVMIDESSKVLSWALRDAIWLQLCLNKRESD